MTSRPAMPGRSQQSLSDVVYDGIRGLIVDGTWPPRSRLPSEAELVAQFGISRPIVRQALARLRENGFVASRQGSGSYVRDIAEAQPEVQFPPIGSVAELDRFLSFREGVEGEIAAAAATAHTSQRVAELRRASETKDITPADDFDFHFAVAKASENPFYVNTLASLKDQVLFGMNLARSFFGRRQDVVAALCTQHRGIVEAIIERNPTAARERMRNHLQWSRARILTGTLGEPGAEG